MRLPVAGATGEPSGSGSAKSGIQRLHDVVSGSGRGVTGGQAVPAAAERAGDRCKVIALRAHRHRPVRGFDLLEYGRDLRLLSGAHYVDDAFDFLRTRVGPFLVCDNGIDQPTTTGGGGQK